MRRALFLFRLPQIKIPASRTSTRKTLLESGILFCCSHVMHE